MPLTWRVLGLSLLAAGAGVSLVIQAALNARLRTSLASWSWAGFVSYLGGTLVMAAVLLAQRPGLPTVAGKGIPWWAWTGGFFGAAYIAIAIVLVPRLGAASMVALVIAGQMLASLAFDHFGLLGLRQHSASMSRVLAALLLVGAVVLMRR